MTWRDVILAAESGRINFKTTDGVLMTSLQAMLLQSGGRQQTPEPPDPCTDLGEEAWHTRTPSEKETLPGWKWEQRLETTGQ